MHYILRDDSYYVRKLDPKASGGVVWTSNLRDAATWPTQRKAASALKRIHKQWLDIEIGFVLKRTFWGAGYATEACLRLLQFAFLETDLDAIYATADPENLASQNVLRKCGFRDLGLIHAFAGHYPGFKIMREDWQTAWDNIR